MMKGNTSAVGNNIKSFSGSASVPTGSNDGFGERGPIANKPADLNIKDFSKVTQTAAGVQK